VIAVGSDHRGVDVKRAVIETLVRQQVDVQDLGTHDSQAVDYPDYAGFVARAVAAGTAERGVLVCGTGIGMSIAANKVSGVRAALVHDIETARLSRLHNDANVLVLAANRITPEMVPVIVDAWLHTEFEGGRHVQRLAKIRDLEDRH